MSEVRVNPTTDAAERFRAWLASPERTIGLDWPWYLQFRPEAEDEPEEPALTTFA